MGHRQYIYYIISYYKWLIHDRKSCAANLPYNSFQTGWGKYKRLKWLTRLAAAVDAGGCDGGALVGDDAQVDVA